MLIPAPSDMLGAWERGVRQGPVERGLTLLGLACPDRTGDSLAELSIGERDGHLLALREATFGPRLIGLASCPSCGEQLELDVAAADLRAAAPVADPPRLRWDGYDVALRLPDSRDLLACAQAAEEDGAAVLLHRCVHVMDADGAPVGLDALPPGLIERAASHLASLDPRADLRFALECVSCAHRWSAPFDVVAFLWTELDAWAARMLHEVHLIASVYGWSERDIVGLSPVRRQAYLRMLGA